MAKNIPQEFPLGEQGEWFVGSDGEMYEAIDGSALSGERSEWHYKQRGPYLKVSADGVEWAKIRMRGDMEARLRAEIEALTDHLARIRAVAAEGEVDRG